MNEIFVPYVYQKILDNIFFYSFKDVQGKEIYGTCSSGLYNQGINEENIAYAIIFELLLLYDRITITYGDFIYLTDKLDHGFIRELLKANVLKIIDTSQYKFSVEKTTSGIIFIEDYNKNDRDLYRKRKNLPGKLTRHLERNISHLENDREFISEIISQSNKDLENHKIKKYTDIQNYVKGKDDMTNYKLNHVYYMNYFYSIQKKLKIKNMYQDDVLYNLLLMKANSHIGDDTITSIDAFNKIKDLERLPNISKLIISGNLTYDDIIKIRESKNGRNFRAWLGESIELSDYDINEVQKIYFEDCTRKTKLQKINENNFVKTAKIGFGFLLSPLVSVGVNVVDNATEKVLDKWKPNFFIRDITKRL